MFRLAVFLSVVAFGVFSIALAADKETEIEALIKKAGGTTKRPLHVTYVDLSSAEIPVDDLLKRLPELPDMSHLNLNGARIGDDGSKLISKCKELTDLRISDTLITAAGICELRQLSRLTYLDISGTAIDSKGIKELAKDINAQVDWAGAYKN